MAQLVYVPKYGGSNDYPVGGPNSSVQLFGDGLPSVSAGQNLMVVAEGLGVPGQQVALSVLGRPSKVVGVVSPGGLLAGPYTVDASGSVDGLILSVGGGWSVRGEQYIPFVPAPPVPAPPPSVLTLAQAVCGSNNPFSFADLQGRPECPQPAIPYMGLTGGMLDHGPVGYMWAATDDAANRAAALGGFMVSKFPAPQPDPTDMQFLTNGGEPPLVNWFSQGAKIACAGPLVLQFAINQIKDPLLMVSLIQGAFNSSKVPGGPA